MELCDCGKIARQSTADFADIADEAAAVLALAALSALPSPSMLFCCVHFFTDRFEPLIFADIQIQGRTKACMLRLIGEAGEVPGAFLRSPLAEISVQNLSWFIWLRFRRARLRGENLVGGARWRE
jgi:hypothetical protein